MASNLLDTTAPRWGLWSSRTQVLGLVAARSDVLDHWEREDPDNSHLSLLRVRVLVERALATGAVGVPEAGRVEYEARAASVRAARLFPEDPVPWLCLLALAVLDPERQLPEHRFPTSDYLLPPGPWRLFDEAIRRDAFSREAHHRMLRYWQAVYSPAAADFVHSVMPRLPAGSSLAALPLYLSVEQYRRELRKDSVRRQWLREPHVSRTVLAYESWRASSAENPWPVADLSHLAHALWASAQMGRAVEVFEALGPFASPYPWATVADSPDRAEEFMETAHSQAYAGRATAMAW
ncbi:hypothetical protein AB0D22_06850 [Kitasatospora sp. NPDC048538]|uniref:hypothetical protein n=1 Tax=Kitasatospora sp. NPDC048538 TaxID=3155633 RepID=UPI0033C22504